MKKRVYVLEYKIHVNILSLDTPKLEQRTEYYKRNERDDFISRYLELKDKYYISNLVGYYSELVEVSVEAMTEVI